MEKRQSFSKIGQEIRHNYRNDLNTADSTEDVKKFFFYAIRSLVKQAFADKMVIAIDDIMLDQEAEGDFVLATSLQDNVGFMEVWKNSDLQKIVGRFAESAINHIKHLEDKQPDKTEAKIYPTSSHSGRRFNNPPPKRGH